MTELLVARKERYKDRINFKVVDKRHNSWTPSRYEKIILDKNPDNLSCLLFDLYKMGYPIEKAFKKFKEMLGDEPNLFFLK